VRENDKVENKKTEWTDRETTNHTHSNRYIKHKKREASRHVIQVQQMQQKIYGKQQLQTNSL